MRDGCEHDGQFCRLESRTQCSHINQSPNEFGPSPIVPGLSSQLNYELDFLWL
jgi:hypothetical protein